MEDVSRGVPGSTTPLCACFEGYELIDTLQYCENLIDCLFSSIAVCDPWVQVCPEPIGCDPRDPGRDVP